MRYCFIHSFLLQGISLNLAKNKYMVHVNEYFEGKVKSLSFHSASGSTTVGVMNPGAYTFNTDKKEVVTVISGVMTVKLPGFEDWEIVRAGESFEAPASSSFDLKIYIDTAYLCEYVG